MTAIRWWAARRELVPALRTPFARWSAVQILGALGLLIVVAVVLVAILAPVLAPVDPAAQDVTRRLRPPFWSPGGTPDRPLGTDQLGRDLLSRLMYGARISLLVGVGATAIAIAVGVVLGLLAGYTRGFWSGAIIAIADAQLAFPFLLLAIGIAAALGPSLFNVMFVLTISSWVVFTRLVRGSVLSLREQDFVLAARTIGATDARIIFRHILPHVMNIVLVMGTVTVGRLIVFEAALSFLGLGVQPPTPTWGGILADGRNYLQNAPWIATLPGIAITVTVLAINFVGDSLRTRLDPKLRRLAARQQQAT